MMAEHYFTEKPTSKLVLYKNEFIVKRAHKKIQYYSASGVFAIKKVDKGSELLIDKAIIKSKQKILDLGCGYGIVGIAIKTIEPSVSLTFSDINERALELVNKNIKLNGFKADVVKSDGFGMINKRFDTILLNPPQTAGKDVCFRLIKDSKEHLNKLGSLQIVARHKKGGRVLADYMKEIFGNVKELGKGSGFRVYCAKVA